MQSKEQEKTVFTPKDDLVGKVLGGKYEVLSLLGKGGMSSVYKVKHIVLGREYAVKMMHSHLVADDNAIARFKQEAAAACALSHPNIIAVHDFDHENRRPYQAIDYLEGISLSDAIRVDGKLDTERALSIFIQACEALAHAHAKGVIHRDLKPSNIMLVTHNGQPDFVKIVDFGIAKVLPQEGEAIQALTQTGEVFGSPLYMSPEQCLGNKLDARSDIYSMGCLMYETLTGSTPFFGETVFETIQKHIDEVPKSLRDVLPPSRLRHALSEIVAKTLAKQPHQRQQSMDELLNDLKKAQQGQGDTLLGVIQRKFHLAAIRIEPLRKRGLLQAWFVTSLVAVGFVAFVGLSFHSSLSAPVTPYASIPWPEFTSEAEVSHSVGKNNDALGTARIALDNILSHIAHNTNKEASIRGLLSVAVAYGQNGEYDDAARLGEELYKSLEAYAAEKSGRRFMSHTMTKKDLPDMLPFFSKDSSRIDALQCLAFIGDACYMQRNWALANFYYELAEEQMEGESDYAEKRLSMKHADALLMAGNYPAAYQLFLRSTGRHHGQKFESQYLSADTDDAFCADRATWMSKVGDTLMGIEDYWQAVDAYAGAAQEWKKDKASLAFAAQADFHMAQCYEKLGKPDEAEKALLDAVECVHQSPEAKFKTNLPAIWNQIATIRAQKHDWLGWLQASADAHRFWFTNSN